MLCNFLDLMVNNGLNILNLFFEIFKSEYKYSLTINKVEDIENMLSNIKNSFPFSDLPKTIAKQISDFVFLDDIPDYPNPIYPLKKEIIKILKNHNLLDTNNLLEYIPTLYGNYIMSYKILDCKDIFKFIITNLLSDNHNEKISYEKIENIRSQIIKKINQEDNKATIDAYKYFLYLFNQELNIFN